MSYHPQYLINVLANKVFKNWASPTRSKLQFLVFSRTKSSSRFSFCKVVCKFQFKTSSCKLCSKSLERVATIAVARQILSPSMRPFCAAKRWHWKIRPYSYSCTSSSILWSASLNLHKQFGSKACTNQSLGLIRHLYSRRLQVERIHISTKSLTTSVTDTPWTRS